MLYTGPVKSFAPLGAALNRVVVGEPLPLDIYDKDRVLLLAHGNTVESARQLQLLVERGGLVLFDEISDPLQIALHAPRARLPKVWGKARDTVVRALSKPSDPQFSSRLHSVLPIMQTLVERDPDLAIFQVIRQGVGERGAYAARDSMFASALCLLLGNRLGWSGEMVEVAAKCALTMNISILDLLGDLAARDAQVGPAERRALDAHPVRSREILEAAGIDDGDWLGAVEEHHERPDGSGYPAGRADPGSTSQLVRCVDLFVEGVVGIGGRSAAAPTQVLGKMYVDEPKSPYVAALIKEFGVYPPGSVVRLKNGEEAMVVQRGPTTTSPVVAVLGDGHDASRPPIIRYTTEMSCRVVGPVTERAGHWRGRQSPESIWNSVVDGLPPADRQSLPMSVAG